ncbi:PREDICTED: angio-associated migratory cell protein-like isoform X1 [Amphimedon queenslandica]|uniref:Anaphase-promoting complex subunit 4 WD40 domain-containing protein n=1 Tax=Amphimedon queenslandica TaxID=400682 RepID=A0AAN0K0T6_AMPQE|nr:PREDICTED: angio-associated migratory cell protein-like isoform X1 [Amphimedon queenslandica]|eukprot:XP_019862778.1 PREDICTED: angio-associated migratory cell protein-like isoform X1 [Amphimedon queenslandica]
MHYCSSDNDFMIIQRRGCCGAATRAKRSMDDEENDQELCEDDVVEIISLSEGEEQPIEDLEADLDGVELSHDKDGSDDEYSMGVMVIQPLRDDSITCLNEHRGPVFAIDVNSNASLVASGSQDDRALVWSTSDKNVVFECNGHTESVTCVCFSHDDKYLATSDLAGLVQVWQCSNEKCVWRFDASNVEWLMWHTGAHVLLAGTTDGDGWIWRIPSGDCKTIPSHGSGNMAGVLMPNGKSSCFGYSDGSVKIWDLKTVSLVSSYNPSPNQMSPVTCLSVHPDASVLVSGHIDGTARLFNASNMKLIAMLNLVTPGGENKGTSQENEQEEPAEDHFTEAVGFLSSHNLILVGYVTGSLAVWDIPTQKLRHVCKPEKNEGQDATLVRMCVSERGPFVYSCHFDGVIRLWNVLTAQCMREWHGHTAGILDIKLTKDESMILSSSDDSTVRLYETRNIT